MLSKKDKELIAAATDAISSFLVDGTVPRDGTLCPA